MAQGGRSMEPLPSDSFAAGKELFIRNVIIEGNKKTKRYIVERELFFKKGDRTNEHQLAHQIELSQRQLVNTLLFLSVQINTRPAGEDMVDVVITLKERWYILPIPYLRMADRNFNDWWTTYNRDLDRLYYGLKFTYNNVSGRNDKFRLWLINGYARQVQMNYNLPNLGAKLNHGVGFNFNYSRVREVQYNTINNKQAFFPDTTERRIQNLSFVREFFRADVLYLYRPQLKARHAFRISFISDHVNDSVVGKNPGYFGRGRTHVHFPEMGYTYQYLDVDYIYYPLKGTVIDASLTVRDPLGIMQMYQVEASLVKALPLGKTTFLNLGAAGALKLPLDQPFYNRKLIGYTGNNNIRGLEYYVVDGLAYATSRATIKQQILNFRLPTFLKKYTNHEYIPFKIFFKIYGDMGYAYSRPEVAGYLNNRLIYTGGLGLDILSFYDIVLKLEYSFNQFGQSGLFLHNRLE